MAVLCNEYSISAAEFFAASLQEYGAATVVGGHTLGKGYAQTLIPLSGGGAVNLSTSRYYTAKGVSLAGVGIAPDVEAELSEEKLANFPDPRRRRPTANGLDPAARAVGRLKKQNESDERFAEYRWKAPRRPFLGRWGTFVFVGMFGRLFFCAEPSAKKYTFLQNRPAKNFILKRTINRENTY